MDTFVTKPVSGAWKSVHANYEKALSMKSSKMKEEKRKELISLDKWFQSELPKVIQGRESKHITHDELCKLMKWKLTRGKFRPRLTELVKTNSEADVKTASTKAFTALPNVSSAIQALTVLKAVGPATASAVLAAGAPEHAAFMADESMEMLPGLQPIKYDLPFYKTYMGHIMELVKQLNKQEGKNYWTPHNVELTLWTFKVMKVLDKELLVKVLSENPAGDENNEPPKKKVKR